MPLKKGVAVVAFDLADYIDTASDVRATLAAAIEDGDPAVFTKMLGAIARSEGMSKLAAETGLTRASLYKSFADEGNPQFSTVAKVLKALNLQITVRARRGRKAMSPPTGLSRSDPPMRKAVKAKTAASSVSGKTKPTTAVAKEKTLPARTVEPLPPRRTRKTRAA